MANIKQALGGTAAITISLVNIASYASRESTAVDNTSNLYLDAALMIQIQFATAPTGSIWTTLNTSLSTNYAFPATGTDAAITIPDIGAFGGEVMGQQHSQTDLIVLGKVNCPNAITATGTVTANFGSVAAALGGNLTPKWAPVITNGTGSAFGATTANINIWYDGIYATSV